MGGLVLKEIINFFVLLVSLSFMLASNLNALTIYEAIEKVVNNSPELRIIFEKKNQVIEDYKETKSSYMPKVYFVFNKEYQKVDPLTSSSMSSWVPISKFQLFLEQRIFDMEQSAKIVKSAQLVQSQEYQNQKLLETLIEVAIRSYYDVIQSEYSVSIYREYLRQVRDIEQLTVSMRQQGDATLGDVNLVQSRLASANSSLILAQANLDKARLKLAYLLNLVDKNQVSENTNMLPDLSNKDFITSYLLLVYSV